MWFFVLFVRYIKDATWSSHTGKASRLLTAHKGKHNNSARNACDVRQKLGIIDRPMHQDSKKWSICYPYTTAKPFFVFIHDVLLLLVMHAHLFAARKATMCFTSVGHARHMTQVAVAHPWHRLAG